MQNKTSTEAESTGAVSARTAVENTTADPGQTGIRGFFTRLFGLDRPRFGKRLALVLTGVFFMGFFLSFLLEVNYGQDPCSFMNVSIAQALGMTFGNWQLLLNCVLFAFVILFSRLRYIGVGTFANMICIGYISDFFRFVWSRVLPQTAFTEVTRKIPIFIVSILGFVFAAAFYMNADMGTSPYDAAVMIIDKRLPKVPFTVIRIAWDMAAILIGVLAGGRVPVGTIILAFALGPAVSFVGKRLKL